MPRKTTKASSAEQGGQPKIPGISVYQRRGRWTFMVYLDKDPLTGKRPSIQGPVFDTDAEAFQAAVLAKAKAEENGGKKLALPTATVKEVVAGWLVAVKDSVKPSQFANWETNARAYVYPTIGHLPFRKTDVTVLNAFYSKLSNDGRIKPDNNLKMYQYWSKHRDQRDGQGPTSREIAKECGVTIHAAKAAVTRYRRGRVAEAKPTGLARKSIKNIHGMLCLVWIDVIGQGFKVDNATTNARIPKQPGRRRSRTREATWTVEHLARWLAFALRDRFYGLWVLEATTGMRRSELAGADEVRLDREKKILHVHETRVVVNGVAEDSDGKTDAGWRAISLDDFTFEVICRYIDMLHEEAKKHGKGYANPGKLAVWPDGKLVHPDTLTRRFNKLVDLAGVPKIRLHDVRHAYVTLARILGVNRKILADRVGHANETVTDTVYTHVSVGHDRELADKLGGAILEALKEAASAELMKELEESLKFAAAAAEVYQRGELVAA